MSIIRRCAELAIGATLLIVLAFVFSTIVEARNYGGYSGYRGSANYSTRSWGGGYGGGGYNRSSPLEGASRAEQQGLERSQFEVSKPTVMEDPFKYYRQQKASYSAPRPLSAAERTAVKKQFFLWVLNLKEVPQGTRIEYIIPLDQGGDDEPYNMKLVPIDGNR